MQLPILVLNVRDLDFTDKEGQAVKGRSVNFVPIVTDEAGELAFSVPDKAFFKGKAAANFGAAGYYLGTFSLKAKNGSNVLQLVGAEYVESVVIPASVA